MEDIDPEAIFKNGNYSDFERAVALKMALSKTLLELGKTQSERDEQRDRADLLKAEVDRFLAMNPEESLIVRREAFYKVMKKAVKEYLKDIRKLKKEVEYWQTKAMQNGGR